MSTSNLYAKHLKNAVDAAKQHWGKGWDNLTDDMKTAYICRNLVGNIAGIDFEDTFAAQVQTETEKKLLKRLTDLTAVLEEAVKNV